MSSAKEPCFHSKKLLAIILDQRVPGTHLVSARRRSLTRRVHLLPDRAGRIDGFLSGEFRVRVLRQMLHRMDLKSCRHLGRIALQKIGRNRLSDDHVHGTALLVEELVE